MSSAVMKGLRFADTQESCFEAWKSSHSVVLSCYVVDLLIPSNRVFRLRKVQILVVEGGRSVYIHEFCFQAAKLSDMECVELQVPFVDYQE